MDSPTKKNSEISKNSETLTHLVVETNLFIINAIKNKYKFENLSSFERYKKLQFSLNEGNCSLDENIFVWNKPAGGI